MNVTVINNRVRYVDQGLNLLAAMTDDEFKLFSEELDNAGVSRDVSSAAEAIAESNVLSCTSFDELFVLLKSIFYHLSLFDRGVVDPSKFVDSVKSQLDLLGPDAFDQREIPAAERLVQLYKSCVSARKSLKVFEILADHERVVDYIGVENCIQPVYSKKTDVEPAFSILSNRLSIQFKGATDSQTHSYLVPSELLDGLAESIDLLRKRNKQLVDQEGSKLEQIR